MAALEAAALSGELFTTRRSISPTRSNASTPSPTNTDDELNLSDDDEEGPHDEATPITSSTQSGVGPLPPSTNHGGAAQTGPKGVINDRAVSESLKATANAQQIQRILADQARRAMVIPTSDEEAMRKRDEARRERGEIDDDELRAKWRRERREELARKSALTAGGGRGGEDEMSGSKGSGAGIGIGGLGPGERGGLKEVGKEGFVLAVERRGWVIVLVYEPYIPRCKDLLLQTLHLSLNLPPTSSLKTPIHVLRARASSLAFSLLPPDSSLSSEETLVDIDHDIDRRDGGCRGYDNDGGDGDEGSALESASGRGSGGREGLDRDPVGRPDPDVLPTMLVYRDGELVRTWIRVDWEISQDGLEGLLRREGILPSLTRLEFGQNRRPKDDEHEDDD